MKVVLLAAGAGTRLAPLTDRTPKILVPVAGEPLLDRQLRYLAAQEATEVAVNVHHHADQVEAFVAARWHWRLPLVRLYREETLAGTAGALLPMRDFLDEPFVVLYGDILTNLDLRALLDDLTGDASIACYAERDSVGVLDVSVRTVNGFQEKPQRIVNAGIYALSPSILDMILPGDDFGQDLFPRAIQEGAEIDAYRVDGATVVDVGTPRGLARAEETKW